jgi:hypothetical protein
MRRKKYVISQEINPRRFQRMQGCESASNHTIKIQRDLHTDTFV